jgi:two-component system, chemotaxis family, protein-glutamate methylesterase/glutaminase
VLRILIVDDSVVFRSQIRSALESSELIEIAGVANNGKVALQKLAQMSVDLVVLDMEMPEMNGPETIREIRRLKFPVRIVVFSSHTTRGSEATLEALIAGADDFITKPSGAGVNFENSIQTIRGELLPKVLQFSNKHGPVDRNKKSAVSAPEAMHRSHFPKRDLSTFLPSVIVIGSSTGGPPALEKILLDLAKPIRLPILITQHMPPVFTASLAKRLEALTGIVTAEAKDMEHLLPNRIYIAPGNFHMSLQKKIDHVCIRIDQSPQRNSVRPAVDPLFESAAKIYGSTTMGIILTGMGEDGFIGARAIKEAGGGILIQDKESSVVFGMPGAVFNAGFHDEMGDLVHLNNILKRITA